MYEYRIDWYTKSECERGLSVEEIQPTLRTPRTYEFLAHTAATDHRPLAHGWGYRCRLSLYCGAAWQA